MTLNLKKDPKKYENRNYDWDPVEEEVDKFF